MLLRKGINLGGYLSQCPHTKEYYEDCILESDIGIISEMGFDHVRLPVDIEVLEDRLGNPNEECLSYVDRVIEWCSRRGLNVVLDLHKAFGYDFDRVEGNLLFHDETLKNHFVLTWQRLARRYGKKENVVFELLNEVVEEGVYEKWNELAGRTIAAIREITDTLIIYGGVMWNSALTVDRLKKPEYENIMYTFHFYEPLLFTHQRAYWVKNMPDCNIAYPGKMEAYKELSAALGNQGETVLKSGCLNMGREFMDEMIGTAVKAAEKNGVKLYCGEFGVIDRAPLEDTARWFEDIAAVLKKYDIGFAIWNYTGKDFGLIDEHYAKISDRILRALTWEKGKNS